MGLAGQLVPAEEPHRDEGGFQEEGGGGLDGQQRPEDVAHIGRVADQFVPNWNSSVMPVTMPMAKLMRKSLPQNFVMRL